MSASLDSLMAELERFGESNDAVTAERPRRMLNITRDTGEFLSVLVRAMFARQVLEIGTSNGYSTLWLAEAATDIGGSVTSVEFSEFKVKLASDNFARSGLSSVISLIHDDAGRVLERAAPTHSTLSSSIPNVRSILAGGRTCVACLGQEGCWWSITPSLTPNRWHPLLRW